MLKLRNQQQVDDDGSSQYNDTMDSRDSSTAGTAYGSFRFGDSLKVSRDRTDTTIETTNQTTESNQVVESNTKKNTTIQSSGSSRKDTYGSFQFDDTLKSKDISLVSKLRDLVERMDFMEKSVMVRLDRIENRLKRLEDGEDEEEEEKEENNNEDDAVFDEKERIEVLKKEIKKKLKNKKKRKKKKKSLRRNKIRVSSTVRASRKIQSSDPETHLHAKAGDEFQVLRIHKDEGKLFVMNKRTWKKGLIPHEESLELII